MRLHRLEVTAFGPYAGTERVDFDGLSEAGLFLINGPTGAGKTSVLDAVCFALYGQVPSVRNAVKDLRSDHAAPGVAPQVRLEVTLRGRRFRITRSPAWQRPKLRGTGTIEEKAKVVVEEHEAGAWIGRSTRNDEAGHLVSGLLGMNAGQFCQVVLLPQGDFAAFLRADAEKRRGVLEKLFATEKFAQVEKWLGDRRAGTHREADQLGHAARSVADRVAEWAVTERPDDEPGTLPGWAAELTAHLTDLAAAANTQVTVAEGALATAREHADHARTLAERQQRHADARRRETALAERAGERGALAFALEAADRADRVLPLLKNIDVRARRLRDATEAVARNLPDGLSADADILRKEERERRDEAAALDQLRGEATRLSELRADIERGRSERAVLDQREAEASALIQELPGRREARRSELAEARRRAAAMPAAETVVTETKRHLDAAVRRDALAAALASGEAERLVVVDEAQAAREAYLTIRQARLDGMAVRLAEALVPGEPCRVCGSVEHPAPAEAADLPSDADEARAETAYERAQERRETITSRLAGLRAELETVADEAGTDELRAARADAEAERAGLAGADDEVTRLDGELLTIDAEYEAARERQSEAAGLLAENRTRTAAQQEEVDRLRSRIDDARGDDPTLDARIGRLGREADRVHATIEALDAEHTAASELTDARDDADKASAAEGFGSPADVRAAALDADDRQDLRRRAKAYDDEEAAVRELLGDPALAAAAAVDPPDLRHHERALAEADEAYRAFSSARDRAVQRRDRLAELTVELRAAVAAWRPAHERHAVAARLADLAAGTSADNELHMRLSAYVLAARLEQVVAAANERLARMSGGRYALEHTVGKAAGDRKRSGGGLGLLAVDAWTGVARDPATLSGGESFITSLALALGLADVVTTEAGGAEIGTLFVDEGFGTLDQDTLDEVMTVLDTLRDGGRAVGIVSHVTELRTRIPTRLTVQKTPTGSTLTTTP